MIIFYNIYRVLYYMFVELCTRSEHAPGASSQAGCLTCAAAGLDINVSSIDKILLVSRPRWGAKSRPVCRKLALIATRTYHIVRAANQEAGPS